MSIIFEKIPYWIPIILVALPWISVIVDIIKTRKLLTVFNDHYSFIIWSLKIGFFLMIGRSIPLSQDPWVLLLLIWGILDMKLWWYSSIIRRLNRKVVE